MMRILTLVRWITTMIKLKAILLAILLAPSAWSVASDLGNGTYANPVLYLDAPDPDVCRVGDSFYMVSTTMHMSPGCTIMKSKDLVNWKVIGYAHDELGETDNFALKNGQNVYATGSWAANLRYDKYEERFYLIVTCNTTTKSYIFTCKDIEVGKWVRSEVQLCYDPGLLFDDTGTECKKYVVCPNYDLNKYEGSICAITSKNDGTVSLSKKTKIIDYGNLENPAQGLRAEGYHGYKIGDYYYIFMIQGVGAQRQEIVWRSKSLEPGSFEGKLVFAGDIIDEKGAQFMPYTGVAQGGIVDTPDGKWYAMLFEDYGAVGRIPVLIPMTWSEDGWPVIGNNGKSVNEINAMPVLGQQKDSVVKSDEFNNSMYRYYPSAKYADVTGGEYGWNGSNLFIGWQWNHNPDNRYWSLTSREGYLRLTTGSLSTSIRNARNTLTQRTFGPTCSGEVAMEVANMKNGDCAGLASYQNQYGFVGVKQENGKRMLIMQRAMKAGDAAGRIIAGIAINQDRVYLRVNHDFTDKKDVATFYYSLDGKQWYQLGDELKMNFDWPDFVGQRFGLFNFATQETGGYVDFDYFHVSGDLSTDYKQAPFDGAPDHLTLGYIGEPNIDLLPGNASAVQVSAVYADGSMTDVTSDCTVSTGDATIVNYTDGKLVSKDMGTTDITITNKTWSTQLVLHANVTMFPLTALDPTIWADGTYDKSTTTLTTGQYGFGGWSYPSGIDISEYKSIEIKLKEKQTCAASFRLFDENSYWSKPSSNNIGDNTTVTLDIVSLKREDGKALDPSHIYISGFWSLGGSPIAIESISLIKNTTSINTTVKQQTAATNHCIYNLNGMKENATVQRQLQKGVYIRSGKKIMMGDQ